MIVDSVREFLSSELPIERLRPHATPVDLNHAHQSMVELGWFGVGLPESAHGTGMGLVEEMLIQRECGRFLVSPSVLATVLAAHVAYHANNMPLVSNIIAGKTSAALGILDSPDGFPESNTGMVLDWQDTDLVLLWNDKGMGLFAIDALTNIQPDECLDESVSMHSITINFDGALCWVDNSVYPLGLHANLLLAAQMVGLADRACDLAVEYAKVREQFGQAIGSFQAVKHRCADMGVRARLSWYQTNLACLKLQASAEDAPLQVASAKLLAAQAAHENGRAGIQVHGGIGYQSECDAHWFVKRAYIYDQAGGNIVAQTRHVVEAASPLW